MTDRQKDIRTPFRFSPFYNPREWERGAAGIVRHNLLSANRRGVDVKHAQTHVPGFNAGRRGARPVGFGLFSVSFSIETLPDASIISGFVREKRLEFNWVVHPSYIACSRRWCKATRKSLSSRHFTVQNIEITFSLNGKTTFLIYAIFISLSK